MKIDYANILEIRPAQRNMELTEIVLINSCSIYVKNNHKQFCISLNANEEKAELWIER